MLIGTLYSVDFHEVGEPSLLNDSEYLVAAMGRVINIARLKIVGIPMVHRFSPKGLTYLVLLSQSHLAVHTWPEHRFMTVDFFTCGDAALGRHACQVLQESLPCGQVAVRTVERYLDTVRAAN